MSKKIEASSTGQALIEWILISLVIFGTLSFCLNLSKNLLDQTIADTWAVFGSRAALSGIQAKPPKGSTLKASGNGKQGYAEVWSGKSRAKSKISAQGSKAGFPSF